MSEPRAKHLDPIVMMVAAIALAIVLTWITPAGEYVYASGGHASPGSFHPVAAHPASCFALFTSLPLGMAKSSGLMFMVLFLAGMFGVLRATGSVEAVIGRAAAWSGGRAGLVAPVVMVIVSAGSTFLGLTAECLLVIPIVLTLAERINRSRLFGFAMIAVSYKIGYLASVTNPHRSPASRCLAGWFGDFFFG